MPLGRSDRGHAIAQLVYEHSVHLKLGQVRSVPNKRVGAADNRCARYWRKGDSNPYASQPLFSVIELQLVHHGELLARLSDYAAHPARHTRAKTKDSRPIGPQGRRAIAIWPFLKSEPRNQVRTRLPARGKWIRTLGPP